MTRILATAPIKLLLVAALAFIQERDAPKIPAVHAVRFLVINPSLAHFGPIHYVLSSSTLTWWGKNTFVHLLLRHHVYAPVVGHLHIWLTDCQSLFGARVDPLQLSLSVHHA